MIAVFHKFLTSECTPRWKQISWTSAPWLAAAFGCVMAQLGVRSRIEIAADEFISGILNYSSIAFGFSVTGMTLCLALSDQAFVRKMVQTTAAGHSHNTYSDLLFVFAWTALAHIAMIVASIWGLFAFKKDANLFSPDALWWQTLGSGVLLAILFYCVCQFVVTVLTLSSVGRVYIQHLSTVAEPSQDVEKKHKQGELVAPIRTVQKPSVSPKGKRRRSKE